MSKVKLVPFKVESVMAASEEIPYGISMMNAPKLWQKGYKGSGVVVAVLDTGCDYYHPDLKDRIIGGRNFTLDYDGDFSNYYDNNCHGTHVAGIISASENSSGIVGVAPEAKLLILKVLSSDGTGKCEDIINAIKYATNWTGPNNEKVRVINMSLGSKEDISELHEAIKNAIRRGILVVCAAGNNGDGSAETSELQYPGGYFESIQVGAVNSQEELAYFSNTNEELDFVAPGVDIISTFPNGQFAKFSGTSMAAPYISGAAVLLINYLEAGTDKILSEQEIYSELSSHAKSIGLGKSAEGLGFVKLDLK